MESKQMLLVLALFFVALPALAQATDFIVGDYAGWALNFDYNAWAAGKQFRVGDKLVFKYPPGKHNVFKVGGPDFQACSVPYGAQAMETGNDIIELTTPGRKWYICGKANGGHCRGTMKLVIDVLPAAEHAPPAYSSPPAKQTPPATPALSPKVFIVGDNYGWRLNFDYAAWAKGKHFYVGDKLVFRYKVGKHNVFKVDGPAFQACAVPAENLAMATGYDVVTLATPGRKWYICGKAYGQHCNWGQKLVIDVLSAPYHKSGRKLINEVMEN